MKFQRILFLLTLFSLSLLPTNTEGAQNNTTQNEAAKPVGLTGWRIGFSNALYLTAPENLKSGGVEWEKNSVAFFPSAWSAENGDVRVEIARGSLARFEDLKKAAFIRAGGSGEGGRNFKIDSYDATQFSLDGKVANVIKHGNYIWAIVILPMKSANAPNVAREILYSLWLERVEKPDWKDRVVGYSWQAELPYELSEGATTEKNAEHYRVRWGDFSVETLKGGAYTNFDKTVNTHIEALSRRPDFKDVRVQRFNREFGFLAKERGMAVQVDFKRGEEPHRIYKIATVTGYGALFTTITMKPGKPEHLAWAHRILGTLRLGYGVPGDDYKRIKFNEEPVSFESETTYGAPRGDEVVRVFVGGDSKNYLFSVDPGDQIIIPLSGEMEGLGTLSRDSMLGNFLKGAGGKLTKAQILPYAVGGFPARRLRFEAEFNGNTVFGDALSILTAQRIYIPVYMTQTASNDKMPRVAGSWQFNFPTPANWKINRSAGNFQVLLPEKAQTKTEGASTITEGNQDGVSIRVESRRENFPDDITVSLDGLTEGERADNPVETDFGLLLRLRQRMERNYGFHWARTNVGEAQGVVGWGAATDLSRQQDAVILRNGTHSWCCEVIWNSRDSKSRLTRDAVLASIACGVALDGASGNPVVATPPVTTPPVTLPPASTSTPPPAPAKPPGEDETDDWGWGWWF